MKAFFSSTVFSSTAAVLLILQMSCATGSVSSKTPHYPVIGQAAASTTGSLPTPEVAVMPTKEGILVAWKPVTDADGYFVYRETQDPPSKKMLGIGPKEALGFIDRNPPESTAQYSVQAFKLSDISNKPEAQALPGTTRQSQSDEDSIPDAKGRRVMYPM